MSNTNPCRWRYGLDLVPSKLGGTVLSNGGISMVFDSLRVWVAQMLGIQLSNSSYNLLGYEGQIVQLLCEKFALCSDS